MSRPASIAADALEPSATCCTSSIFTPGQAASIERSATERAPPTESTPTPWPTMSLQSVLAGSMEAARRSA